MFESIQSGSVNLAGIAASGLAAAVTLAAAVSTGRPSSAAGGRGEVPPRCVAAPAAAEETMASSATEQTGPSTNELPAGIRTAVFAVG